MGPESKKTIFKSDAIRHQDGALVLTLLQFKPSYHSSQSLPARNDAIRAARYLILDSEIESDILAFPKTYLSPPGVAAMNHRHYVVLITTQGAQSSQCWIKIRQVLDKAELEIVDNPGTLEMTPLALQTALLFAMDAKLAPNWNRVSKFFVKSPDFLNLNCVKAVKPDLTVSEGLGYYQAHLSVEAFAMKWLDTPVKLQHMTCIDDNYREKFIRHEIDVIPQQHLGNDSSKNVAI